MARSRFSNNDPENAAQVVDVRVRNRGGSDGSPNENGSPISATSNEKVSKHLIWYCAVHVTLALVAVIMLAAWIVRKHGGFSWKDTEFLISAFNYHPLFMVIAFMLLSGIADILYRVCRNQNKFPVKVAHGTIQLTAFCFIVSALVAVFWYHDQMRVPHLQSAHSWIGLIVVLLVSCQWLVGFCGLLWPGFRPPLRASYVPTHKFTGRCIFVLSLANILIGINKVGGGATIMNVLALVVLLYALNGGYVLARDTFARPGSSTVVEYDDDTRGDTLFDRGTAMLKTGRRSSSDEHKYINISSGAGPSGTYNTMDDDPGIREAMSVGRDTFNRFHERLEKKKALDVPGEFVLPPTTTVTEQ